jgi:hypothetical protein
MASSVPAVKAGLRQYLANTDGLRPTDGWTVRSADPDPREMSKQMIVLGTVTAPQAQAGLATRAETPTLTGWVIATRVGVGEATVAAARELAYDGFALIEGALAADRTAAGTVPAPGRLNITSTTLEEMPVDWDGSAARRAQLQFQVSWESHTAA